jgi:hypothetical protein
MNISTLTCKKCGKKFNLKTTFGTRMSPNLPEEGTPPNVAVAAHAKKVEEEVDRVFLELSKHECVDFECGKTIAC